jgi:hypothetical protein
MDLPEAITRAIEETRAKVRFGYPRWLRLLLMKDVIAITLGRRIYVHTNVTGAALERLLRHELAHVRQLERYGLVGFYARYLAEFARHLRRERSINKAYAMISFEREAVAAEGGEESL